MEMFLERLQRQHVSVPLADPYLEFEAGETIYRENICKDTLGSWRWERSGNRSNRLKRNARG
jgi:hypothetical protein